MRKFPVGQCKSCGAVISEEDQYCGKGGMVCAVMNDEKDEEEDPNNFPYLTDDYYH